MRTGMIALVGMISVVGCKGDKKPPKKQAETRPAAPEPRVPEGPVPVVLPRVDPKHARRVSAATAFVTVDRNGALALGKVTPGATPYAGRARGSGPIEDDLFATTPPPAAGSAGAGSGSTAAGSATTQDDPPPPDDPDVDPDRAQGQYKMKKNQDDAQLARQQAIDAARKAGVLGSATTQGGAFASLTGTGDIDSGFDDTNIYGGLIGSETGYGGGPPIKIRGTFEASGPLDVLVLADAGAHAGVVVQVLGGLDRKRAGIAVDGGKAPDALEFRFGAGTGSTGSGPAAPLTPTTFTLTYDEDGVVVMPSTGSNVVRIPLVNGSIDRDKLIGAVRPTAMTPVTGTVAIVTAYTTTMQQLAETLAALAAAGAPEVQIEGSAGGFGTMALDTSGTGGFGTIGTGGRYGTIGHGSGRASSNIPQVRIGQPSAVGDLDKAIIRRYIKRNIAKITYCYEKELLADPGLEGTVSTQFFIKPSGEVATATASGVDPDVAECVANVIRMIEFPKPKGGGGVQVNYPFTFKATGG